ncbi:MAG: 50S ribosomal protein L6 [Pseudomonadales bacterium]|nr:50S ribosomal protein L6 [Pseudomonadales bacterium]
MSRVANNPVQLPKGVEANFTATQISVKGSKGNLELALHEAVEISKEGDTLRVAAKNNSRQAIALSGTFRALINNMVIGVSKGFERKLQLQGVGYRAKAQGNILNLSVGYSHPVDFEIPKGVTADTPTPTEIVLSGADKQLVGQIAAKIREVRPPEPYKGKGIRYLDETVYRKEAKKK